LFSKKYHKKNYKKIFYNPERGGISQHVTPVIKASSAAGRKLLFYNDRIISGAHCNTSCRPIGAKMTIDKTLYVAPSGKKNKKNLLASESGAEEAQMELDQLLLQFEDWKKDNKGSWRDFLKSHKDRIKLKDGGSANDNSYAQLIDDYDANIEVIEIDGVKESLSNYIKRHGGVKHD
jgi:hypothetical protein